MPRQLRDNFAYICYICQPAYSSISKKNIIVDMALDYTYAKRFNVIAIDRSLHCINEILQQLTGDKSKFSFQMSKGVAQY